ncbi:MAG: putative hydro-lyase [Pseudomonadota bacterium]
MNDISRAGSPDTLPVDPYVARQVIRRGETDGRSAGMAPGFLQGNLVVLPETHALDFFRFCQRNPVPCPLVGVSDTGSTALPSLGRDIDIRTDIGSYNIFRDGELTGRVRDVCEVWRDDLVSFVLGCSYSFEEALAREQVPVRHIELGCVVPMYYSNLMTVPAGPFGGPIVVSMRPMSVPDAIRATEITARFPNAHGKPVHLGDPALIGIRDIDRPDEGDRVPIGGDEIPVFWACGVTPQLALRSARLPFAITHTSGSMLVTDLPAG